MAIVLACPCGMTLKAPDRGGGKTLACPSCRRVATIPADGVLAHAPYANRSTGRWLVGILATAVALLGAILLVFVLLPKDPPSIPPSPSNPLVPPVRSITDSSPPPALVAKPQENTPQPKLNASPTVALDRLVPDKPRAGTRLRVYLKGTTADGTPPTFRYQWVDQAEWTVPDGDVVDLPNPPAGDRILIVQALDLKGQPSAPLQLKITIAPANRPPTLALGKIEPVKPKSAGSLTVLLEGQDPDGDQLTYQYRLGTEGKWQELTEPRLTIKDLKPGLLILEFRALDAHGLASQVEKKSWTLPELPVPKNLVGTPLQLEWKLKMGDALFQEIVVAQQPTYRVAGLPVKALIHYQVISRLSVDSVDAEGNMVVKQKIESATLGKVDDLSRGAIAAPLAKLPGTTLTIHLNKRMEVVKLLGASDKVQAVGGNLLGAGFVQMTSLIEQDAWKEFAQLTFFQPNRPLRAGEKWSTKMTHSWGALGAWTGQAHYVYGGQKASIHKFDYALQLAFQPGKQQGKNLGLISAANFQPPLAGGTFLFDADKNKVVYAEERFRVRGAMSVAILGQNTQVDVEEDQLISIRLTDERPK